MALYEALGMDMHALFLLILFEVSFLQMILCDQVMRLLM